MMGVSAILLGLSVILGAFAAHALKQKLGLQELGWWQTAVEYHRIHALALFLVAMTQFHLLIDRVKWVYSLLLIGMVLFSGSLYLMALGFGRWLGAITPIGGSAWILAWFLFAWSIWKSKIRE